MIIYTMVGTSDLQRAIKFYDPIFSILGYQPCWRDERSTSWGLIEKPMVPRFFIGYPFNGGLSSVGNGAMTAFWVDNEETIKRCYTIGMSSGGNCEGPPGPRPQYGETFYGAYLRDPDGNKIAFVRY